MPIKKITKSKKEPIVVQQPVKETMCNCGRCHECYTHKRHTLFGIFLLFLGVGVIFTQLYPTRRGTYRMDKMIKECKLDFLERKAFNGNVKAQMKMVNALANECSELPFATKKKNYWLSKAAKEENFAPAQYRLALLHEYGETVPRNYRESMKWLKMAAEQNYMPAEFELAKKYKHGSIFIKENPQEYIFWIMRAANHGSDKAAADLGYMYENGVFVPKNKIEAYKWYSLASYTNAKKMDFLEAQMSLEEIEQAQRESHELFKKILEFMENHRDFY